MNRNGLTRSRLAVMQAFAELQRKRKGISPSIRELAETVGLSSFSTVWSHLDKLESLGYFERTPNQPRSRRLTDKAWKALRQDGGDRMWAAAVVLANEGLVRREAVEQVSRVLRQALYSAEVQSA